MYASTVTLQSFNLPWICLRVVIQGNSPPQFILFLNLQRLRTIRIISTRNYVYLKRKVSLAHLAPQTANKGFGEYKKSDSMVVDTKVNNTVANCSNRRSDGKRNLIEDSDEDEDQFVKLLISRLSKRL